MYEGFLIKLPVRRRENRNDGMYWVARSKVQTGRHTGFKRFQRPRTAARKNPANKRSLNSRRKQVSDGTGRTDRGAPDGDAKFEGVDFRIGAEKAKNIPGGQIPSGKAQKTEKVQNSRPETPRKMINAE